MRFLDRQDAGQQLADKLGQYKGPETVVLALPRGGVVLGKKVASTLQAPLGLVLVRKIGHPYYAEYAIGAVAEDEDPLYNRQELAEVDATWRRQAEAAARELIAARRQRYYGTDFTPPDITGKTAIIVDDGIATGLTMQAAVQAVKQKQPIKVVVAVPVAPSDCVATLSKLVDELVMLDEPANFMGAVGAHYQEFEQVNDEEVKILLREASNDLRQKTTSRS